MTKIYESPDGGKTVFARAMNSKKRTIIKSEGVDDLADFTLWNEIRIAAKTNPSLQKVVSQVKLIYRLSIDDPK